MIYEVNIENEEVIKYLDNVGDNELDERIENLIKLGISVMNVANMKLNMNDEILEPISKCMETKMDKLYEKVNTVFNTNNPMMTQMDSLNKTIEDFKGQSKTSALKGKIGEECIAENIQNYFPDCELKNMTKQAHQADFQFSMNDCPNILIEVKTYKSNIPTEQINKFKRDLGSTGFKCGILVSTMTGISKKKAFEWEIMDDKTIVYIPNSGLDGYSVMWGIMFMKELERYKESDTKISKGYEISNKLETLKQAIIDIENTKSIISRTKYNLINNINVSFENLDKEIVSIEKRIHNFILYFS